MNGVSPDTHYHHRLRRHKRGTVMLFVWRNVEWHRNFIFLDISTFLLICQLNFYSMIFYTSHILHSHCFHELFLSVHRATRTRKSSSNTSLRSLLSRMHLISFFKLTKPISSFFKISIITFSPRLTVQSVIPVTFPYVQSESIYFFSNREFITSISAFGIHTTAPHKPFRDTLYMLRWEYVSRLLRNSWETNWLRTHHHQCWYFVEAFTMKCLETWRIQSWMESW